MKIHGKEYVEVKDRVLQFRGANPDWTISTDLVFDDGAACTFKASISDASGRVIATGHAREEKGASNINKTSYVENCETSAVGRAMAFLGIGIGDSIASADEVVAARAAQEIAAAKRRLYDIAMKLEGDRERAKAFCVAKMGEFDHEPTAEEINTLAGILEAGA